MSVTKILGALGLVAAVSLFSVPAQADHGRNADAIQRACGGANAGSADCQKLLDERGIDDNQGHQGNRDCIARKNCSGSQA